MTKLGFLGTVARYVAGETAPVAKDVVNYMGEKTQPGVKSFTKAVAKGIKEGLSQSRRAAEEVRRASLCDEWRKRYWPAKDILGIASFALQGLRSGGVR